DGDLALALAQLREAVALHDLGEAQPLDRGRTLLVLGGVQRRLQQRRAARETLMAAIGTFEGISAPLWASRARAELARVSGRVPGTGELSIAELNVARLGAR